MPENSKNKTQSLKNPSPLVNAVLALDHQFTELIRLGEKIDAMDIKSDFDFEQSQRLLQLFSQHGEGVSKEVVELSTSLHELRARAEAVAQKVWAKAEALSARKSDADKKMEELRALGEEVRVLASSLQDLKKEEGDVVTEEDREKIAKRLADFDVQLRPLIEKAQALQQEGRTSKVKLLEQSADSLRQSLIAITKKISTHA